MSDRELLELAYRAYAPGANYVRLINDAGHSYWNPLTDDGDALRLAVKLRLDVDCMGGDVVVAYQVITHSHAAEQIGHDHYAATRRAIVRAAAEIGRVME